jgi:hypothetical protein
MESLKEIWPIRAMKGGSEDGGFSFQLLHNPPEPDLVTLKMEVIPFSETSKHSITPRCKNEKEDQHLTNNHRKKLKLIKTEDDLNCKSTFLLSRHAVSP